MEKPEQFNPIVLEFLRLFLRFDSFLFPGQQAFDISI